MYLSDCTPVHCTCAMAAWAARLAELNSTMSWTLSSQPMMRSCTGYMS